MNSAITVSQGRAPSQSGLTDDPGIPGGTVTVTWDNADNSQLMANTLTPGHDTSFGEFAARIIPLGSYATGGTPIPITVSLSNITNLDSLDVRIDVIAPSGVSTWACTWSRPAARSTSCSRTRRSSRIPPTRSWGCPAAVPSGSRSTHPRRSAATTRWGRSSTTTPRGTSFDIVPGTNGSRGAAAPYFGDYEPEGFLDGQGTLDGFLQSQLAQFGVNGVNGTWKVLALDSNPSTTATPAVVMDWSLSFGRGLTPDDDVPITAPGISVLPIRSPAGIPTTTTKVPASPVPIGPGVVMAQDNTLGPDSPNEGRIYAAFVGHNNANGNPATNTDIYLTYSDDGGRSWSTPVQVNDDSSDSDGYSQSNTQNPNDSYTGRTQYNPAIAVDPDDRHGGHVLARCPQRPGEHAGGDLHRHQHRRRQDLQPPGLRQPSRRPPRTPSSPR